MERSGFCEACGINIKQGRIGLHYFEEPCISGTSGSGTIFFSGCNLRCKYCQNYKISWQGKGEEISIEELAKKMVLLQKDGANNINLVTGFMYIPQIVESINIARESGLNIPIVYNSSGYEDVEALKLLKGKNYKEIVLNSIKEMLNQQPKNIYNEEGILQKGVIIRHLVLPNHLQNSKQVLKLIKNSFGKNIYISVMAQYFPCYKAKELEDINRKLTEEEFSEIEDFVYNLDLKNGYIQNLEDNEEKYVPNF